MLKTARRLWLSLFLLFFTTFACFSALAATGVTTWSELYDELQKGTAEIEIPGMSKKLHMV